MSKLGTVLALLPALTLVACGTATDDPGADASPAAATTPAAPEAFLAFAESGRRGTDVPWAPTVRFSIAGDQVAELSPEFASRRESWVRCPGGVTSYGGRACPVSALGVLWERHRDDEGTAVSTEAPDEVGCADYRVPWEAATVVGLRPEANDRDCGDDVALALALDDDGRVAAVDLVLSGTG